MSTDWVIVTAPTDRAVAPASELAGTLDTLAERRPDLVFRIAVLSGSGVTVTQALDAAADAGAKSVLVLSAQTIDDRKPAAWFRRVIGHWLRTRAEPPQVRIGASLVDADRFADLLLEAIADGGVAARDTTAPLTSPAWEEVPTFRRHVLVCRGPRCSAQGSAETQHALDACLLEQGLRDDEVLVTTTDCLFPCNQAPVAVVYPESVWYRSLTADRVAQVVDQHLIGGIAIAEWSTRRNSCPPSS